jgi:hypothetical protein
MRARAEVDAGTSPAGGASSRGTADEGAGTRAAEVSPGREEVDGATVRVRVEPGIPRSERKERKIERLKIEEGKRKRRRPIAPTPNLKGD